MAVDMFLKIEGPKMEGEAKDKTYANTIDVLAFNWGLSNSGTMHTGGGGGSGKANFQDITFTTYFDKASPLLIQASTKGTHIDKMTLITRKAGDKPLEYLKIVIENCLVTSFVTGGSQGEDRITANISVNFAKFKVIYTEQDKKGGGKPEVEFGYNIEENVNA